MTQAPIDARSICNLMLDEAASNGDAISNLALQKLLYFAHAHYLIELKKPLVAGYFEAWKFGPVHTAAYAAFKSAGDRKITFRAERVDALTGRRFPLPPPTDPDARRIVRRVMRSYGEMSPGQLVDISHAAGAPWHSVVDRGGVTMAFGLRIADDLIVEKFKFHKVSIGLTPIAGEPGEDTPFA